MKTLSSRGWVWLGALALLLAGAVIYRPSLDIGFWTDDYSFLEAAGRMDFWQYIVFYFDPRFQVQWYRPLQGMMWWVVYVLLGREPFGYHLAQVLIHLTNTLLFYGLAARIGGKWRLGFLAALVYLTLPVYTLAVNWPGVADPVAGLFYLLALWLWYDYLQTGSRVRYGLAVLAAVATMLSKEIGVAVPFTFLFLDLWMTRRVNGPPVRDLVRRYALVFMLLPVYAVLEFTAVTQGVFTQRLGYSVGGHILAGLEMHLSVLAFPWGMGPPFSTIWLLSVLALLAFAAYRRVRPVLFLTASALLVVLPVVPLPVNLAQAPRYLYLPLMASAIGVAWVVEFILRRIPLRRVVPWAGALALALVATVGSAFIGESAVNFAGTTRQVRLQFRPIFQKHATVGPDTLLYFINPPFPTPNISGLMFQRYGTNVRVYGTDRDRPANLRDHQSAYVYYLNDENNWQEQAVEKQSIVPSSAALPVRFGEAIGLQSYELASANVKRGEAVVVLLYWHSLEQADKDYVLFTHLLDSNGQNVAGVDMQPRQGYSPTSRWKPGEYLADGLAIPLDASVRAGDYVLELGLYDPKTMQRLPILDAGGAPVDDKLILGPIHVGE